MILGPHGGSRVALVEVFKLLYGLGFGAAVTTHLGLLGP